MNNCYLMRSKLFVSGTRPELFLKAINSEADAISLDLEDAVHDDLKGQARQNIATFLINREAINSNKLIIVRSNDISHPEIEDDIRAAISPRLNILNLPKVESNEDINRMERLLERIEKENGLTEPIPILANIETPKGLRFASEIANASQRVMGLQVGFADLFGALGIDRADQLAVHQILLQIRLASGEAGIPAYDAAFLNIKDPDRLKEEALRSKKLGFSGKSCIHPSQITAVNQIFMPSEKEINFARELLEYAGNKNEKGEGVFIFKGQMIDKPVLEAAEKLLQLKHCQP